MTNPAEYLGSEGGPARTVPVVWTLVSRPTGGSAHGNMHRNSSAQAHVCTAGAGSRRPGGGRNPPDVCSRRGRRPPADCSTPVQTMHACHANNACKHAQVHNGIVVLTAHLVMVMFTVIAWAFLLVVLVLFRVVVYVLVERLLEMRVTIFAAKVTNYLDTIALPIVLALYLMGHRRALGR